MLGPYRVQQRVGVGTLGNVYRAVHVELDQPVSLKVFPGSLKDDEGGLSRGCGVKRRAAASSTMPTSSATFRIGRGRHLLFRVSRFAGETLQAKLTATARSNRRSRATDVRCCPGTGHLHEKGFVHRDVRPANMWVTTDGVLKLMEFGGVERPSIEGSTTRRPTKRHGHRLDRLHVARTGAPTPTRPIIAATFIRSGVRSIIASPAKSRSAKRTRFAWR